MLRDRPLPLVAAPSKAAHDPGIVLAEVVLSRRDELVATLCTIATHQAALDEVRAAVRLLAGSRWELARYRPGRQSLIATLLPSNNVLYSYVLFGVMSAMYAERVLIRPARVARATTLRIHEILGGAARRVTGNTIDVTSDSQRSFLERCRSAQAVVFNGRFENGVEIAGGLPDMVAMLGFCAGPNPMVVGPEAGVEEASDRLLEQRLFNSGQDCLCTDLVFVHSSLAVEFLDVLTGHLSDLTLGERADPETRVAPLYYRTAVADAAEFLDSHRAWITHGGQVDIDSHRVPPTVIRCPPEVEFHPPEFFAPIFALQTYDDPATVRDWLHSPQELRRGMYVSVFGEPALSDGVIGTSVVCPEATTFEVEDGNAPFGGYGEQANFVWESGAPRGRPLLLSAELARRAARVR